MSRSIPLERQLRGQRISHQELVAEAQAALLRSGMRSYARADFVNQLSKVVVGNRRPVLCQLQPAVREDCAPAWLYAWDLVSSYIAHNNLALTIDTLNAELAQTKQKLRLTLKSARNADEEFSELLFSSASGLSDAEPPDGAPPAPPPRGPAGAREDGGQAPPKRGVRRAERSEH
jgi:hypothetical protein